MNSQTEEAHAAKLKGRHAFGLERLLALFWSLTEEQAALASGDDAEVLGSAGPRDELQSAEVLVQVASLVSMRLLSQVCMAIDKQIELRAEGPSKCARNLLRVEAALACHVADLLPELDTATHEALVLRPQGAGDLLRGAKYTCSVPDALAQDMAKRLGLELQQYVH